MKPLNASTRVLLALIWLGLLAIAGFLLSSRLSMSGDLRKFMPDAKTPEQRLLMDELGEGPGSRLLLLSISGADSETLAAQSRELAAAPWSFSIHIADGCLAHQRVECRVCGELCETKVIRFRPTLGGVSCPEVDHAACTGCGACLAPCPVGAITRVARPSLHPAELS